MIKGKEETTGVGEARPQARRSENLVRFPQRGAAATEWEWI
jgi:hypothetical protein